MSSWNKAISLLTSQEKFYIKLGLERVQDLLKQLDNPQDKIKCIHVAGTNGKGSTCAMLASVLTEAGYKVGLYTSPHIVDYTERIKINGIDISKEDFASLIFRVKELGNATEFEILTAAAFLYFYEQGVDYAVMETGLGGRLDATNVIKKPEMSIITSIDLDHTDRLGDTIDKIAFEKAGIIKKNVPVVTFKDNNGLEIIKEKACSLFLAKNEGLWQERNKSLVRKACEILQISEHAIETGIKNTKWSARFQYIKEKNLLIDAAHNPAGAVALRESLDFYFPDQQRVFVYSSLKTKDYRGVMKALFREDDTVILTKCSSTAAINPETLKKYVNCKQIYVTSNTKEVEKLFEKFNNNQFLRIITGSIYTIGELFASQVLSSRL